MKTFQQFLESVYDVVKINRSDVEIYKNPKPQEYQELAGYYSGVRGFLDPKSKDLYVWNFETGVHQQLYPHLGLKPPVIPVSIWKKQGEVSVALYTLPKTYPALAGLPEKEMIKKVEKDIRYNPNIQRLFPSGNIKLSQDDW
jgi:hypothetical protein